MGSLPPTSPPHPRRIDWIVGTVAGVVALAALVIGSLYGHIHTATLDPRLIAWCSAGGILVGGVLAANRLSRGVARLVALRSVPAAGGPVRIVVAGIGYLVALFAVLAELEVSIERLLVGAGLAGVVLGIAAQQSLGNVFAGFVLLLARPFGVGDHIRIRSGALGGIFDAWVTEVSITYVTLQTEDGPMKVPNSAMLASGVGRLPGYSVPKAGSSHSASPLPQQALPTQSQATAEPGI